MSFNTEAGASEGILSWGPRDAPVAVIALHGRGQGIDSIRTLRDQIDLEHLRWEVPIARDSSWYPQRFMDPEVLDSEDLETALATIGSLVDSLLGEGFRRDQIAILGFSQGACLATQWSLQHPGEYAGLLLFTGGFVGPEGTSPSVNGTFELTPVLIAGPQDDAWVPLSRMRETEDLLRMHDARVTGLFLPPGEHTVSYSEIALARMILEEASTNIINGK